MYNGIGLTTPRGSGTNGYVQRNVACVKRAKERVDYKSEAELHRADELMFKEPNKEILEHERKRRIELKCVEMEELMEDQGFEPDEIRRKVANFRKFLAIEDEEQQKQRLEAAASGKPIFPSVAKDAETGRPVAKGTHEITAARQQQAELMRDALKIDRGGRAPDAAASAAAAAAALPYLRSDSDDTGSDSTDTEAEAPAAAAAKSAKKAAKKAKKDKKRKKKEKRSKKEKAKGKDRERGKEKQRASGERPGRRDRSRSPVGSRSEKRK